MTRCGYYHRSGARCRAEATALVERPTFSGLVVGDREPETVTVGYCARHTPEILQLVGGRIAGDA